MTIIQSLSATVDFNSLDSDGAIRFSARALAGLAPNPGDRIQLRDHEGNAVIAVVTAIVDHVFVAQPLWATWRAESNRIYRVVASGNTLNPASSATLRTDPTTRASESRPQFAGPSVVTR